MRILGYLNIPIWAPTYGPFISIRLSEIQNRIDAWEGADADDYRIQILDVTGYDKVFKE